ncbi:hypothetical protein P5V15_001375 [Pogonomyrmex californicus]
MHHLRVKEIRDNFANRKDNLVVFVDARGEPCGLGARILSKQNLLPEACDVMGRGKIRRVGNKLVIALPVERNVSSLTVLDSIKEALKSLVDIIRELELQTISVCKSDVNGVPFAKIDKAFRTALWDHNLGINICTNEIATVTSGEPT